MEKREKSISDKTLDRGIITNILYGHTVLVGTLPSYDSENAAIHTEAGKENRGFVSVKTYSQTIAKKRSIDHEYCS